jgi:predicted O-methyltransferase YrrM
MFERTKRLGLRVANKIFLRSTTHQNHLDLQELRQQICQLSALVGERFYALETQNAALADRISEAVIDIRHPLVNICVDIHAKQDERLSGLLRTLAETASALDSSISDSRDRIAGRIEVIATEIATAKQITETASALDRSISDSRDRIAGRIEAIATEIATAKQITETASALDSSISDSRDRIAGRIEAIATEIATAKQITETASALDSSISDSRDRIAGRIEAIATEIATAKQITETASALDSSISDSRELILRRIRELLSTTERMSFRQHEALYGLGRVIGTQFSLPYTRGWAASPDLLLFLHEKIRTRKPELVVEFGSGVTSLIIADALQQNGVGRLQSFDHDPAYALATRTRLEQSGLSGIAQVSCVELVDWTPPSSTELGDAWKWYDITKNIDELNGIDMLLVDGPPAKTCAYARYPAAPTLIDRIKPDGLILLDDTIREDETRIAEAWRDQLGLELTFQPDFEKGLAILTLRDVAEER